MTLELRRGLLRRSRCTFLSSIATIATLAAGCHGSPSVTSAEGCASLASGTCAKEQACVPALFHFVFSDLSTCTTLVERQCEASLAAPHTGATPALAAQCGQAFAAVNCEQFLANGPAVCQPHGGTIQTGGACGDPWQCASGRCLVTTGQCGKCVDAVQAGGVCTTSDSECADGLACSSIDSSGVGTCIALVPLGETCTPAQPCAGLGFCDLPTASASTGTCRKPPEAGESCAGPGMICDYFKGAECNPSTNVCQNIAAIVQPGAPCGWIGGQFIECNGICPLDSSNTGSCAAFDPSAAEGQPCSETPPVNCDLGLKCVGGVCTIPDPALCGGPGSSGDADADAGQSASGPAGDIWDGGLADSQLPDHINIDVCANTSQDAGGDQSAANSACFGCCQNNGFQASAIIEGRCVCDTFPQGSETTVCAQQAASVDVCQACCQTAGYNGYGFSGNSAAPPVPAAPPAPVLPAPPPARSSCTCYGLTDSVSCAGTLNASAPAAACQLCCLQHGFIGSGFSNLGTAFCTCM
jgi:hypothetical protein